MHPTCGDKNPTWLEGFSYPVLISDMDFQILAWNKAALTRWKRIRSRLPLESILEVCDLRRKRLIRQKVDGGESWVGKFRLEMSGQREFMIEWTVGPFDSPNGGTCMLHSFHSNPEVSQLERDLVEARRALHSLWANLPGMAYRCRNDRNWTMDFVSQGAFSLTGYQPDELLGNRMISYNDLVHPDDQATLWTQIQGRLNQRQPFQMTYRIHDKDGKMKWVWEQGAGVFDKDNDLLGLEGYIVDISREVEAQHDRQKLENQLLQAQRLEHLGRLTGGVVHDFNNLLTAIVGNVSLTLDDSPLPDAATSRLQAVRDAARRAAGLTRKLLAFTQEKAEETRPFSLNQLLHDLRPMLEITLGPKVRLEWNLSPEVGAVNGDSGQIEQVIMNLAVNARDAMAGKGSLRISTEPAGSSSGECPSEVFRNAKEGIYLSVSDTGTGIPKENLERIFDAFFTTKQPGMGTGLGLATSAQVIRRHGGCIHVDSTIGEGSTFFVYLPRAADSSATEVDTSNEPLSLQGTTLLVAEDDAMVRLVACESLRRAGATVWEASDGIQAEQLLAAQGEGIDLAVITCIMPGADGLEIADALWSIQPDKPVLFISGMGEPPKRQTPGKSQFLPKPFSPETLIARIHQMLKEN